MRIWDDFLNHLLQKAHDARESAGYSGSWSDGGARNLEEQVQCYKAGREGKIPEVWEQEFSKFENERDPEHAEYLRLKQKFEGR